MHLLLSLSSKQISVSQCQHFNVFLSKFSFVPELAESVLNLAFELYQSHDVGEHEVDGDAVAHLAGRVRCREAIDQPAREVIIWSTCGRTHYLVNLWEKSLFDQPAGAVII